VLVAHVFVPSFVVCVVETTRSSASVLHPWLQELRVGLL
jgi:hypothetical protein